MDIIFRLAHQHLDFRVAELESLLDLFELRDKLTFSHTKQGLNETPFLKARLSDIEALPRVTAMASRSIAVVAVYQVIAAADTLDQLVQNVQAICYPGPFLPFENLSFKYCIDSFGKKFNAKETQFIIRQFSFLPLRGFIDMHDPDVLYTILVRSNSPNLPSVPEQWYYTRRITEGNRNSIDYFDLKKRHYIGITSMDAELSLYMCNMAKVAAGHLILDPFAGTGSLLLTASYFGAFTMGSDIDGRQMRGTTTGSVRSSSSLTSGNSSTTHDNVTTTKDIEETMPQDASLDIFSNAKQYGLESRILDLLVFDTTAHPWRLTDFLDAIITDPPYGVRAGAKRISSVPLSNDSNVKDSIWRYPKTEAYFTDQVILDLVDFAAIYLKEKGRLVYWQPSLLKDDAQRESSKETDVGIDETLAVEIPRHPWMHLISACEQKLNGWSRWMITLEKRSSGELISPIVNHAFQLKHFGDQLFKRKR